MHIFLQGPRHCGKSTVIRRVLEILMEQAPLNLGGFFTWNGGPDDPYIYMRPAQAGREREIYRLAGYGADGGGLRCDPMVFEHTGVSLLTGSAGADLLLMDELGFLEGQAPSFRQAVLAALAGDTPVLGVLRLGDIPWHREIKDNPLVTLCEVNEKNRGALPRELAAGLAVILKKRIHLSF